MAPPPIEHINSASKIKIEPSKTHVTLKVNGGDDHDVYFRVQRNLPFAHLKLNYCNRLGFHYGAVRFTYGGAAAFGH
ncbi:Ubiquitin-like protein pmt3/smt3 [Bienertia sinuspersici]